MDPRPMQLSSQFKKKPSKISQFSCIQLKKPNNSCLFGFIIVDSSVDLKGCVVQSFHATVYPYFNKFGCNKHLYHLYYYILVKWLFYF